MSKRFFLPDLAGYRYIKIISSTREYTIDLYDPQSLKKAERYLGIQIEQRTS